MKPKLVLYADQDESFAIIGIYDKDDPGTKGHFFAKVFPPSQVTPEQRHPLHEDDEEPTPTEHVEQAGTWYEVELEKDWHTGKETPKVTLVPDQPGSTDALELLLLAYAYGLEDAARVKNVSHLLPALHSFVQALGQAAVQHAVQQGTPCSPLPPPKPKTELEKVVDLLKKKPPLPAPPPPELPPVQAQPVGDSISAFDREMAELDDFLNDARSKAGGL